MLDSSPRRPLNTASHIATCPTHLRLPSRRRRQLYPGDSICRPPHVVHRVLTHDPPKEVKQILPDRHRVTVSLPPSRRFCQEGPGPAELWVSQVRRQHVADWVSNEASCSCHVQSSHDDDGVVELNEAEHTSSLRKASNTRPGDSSSC